MTRYSILSLIVTLLTVSRKIYFISLSNVNVVSILLRDYLSKPSFSILNFLYLHLSYLTPVADEYNLGCLLLCNVLVVSIHQGSRANFITPEHVSI